MKILILVLSLIPILFLAGCTTTGQAVREITSTIATTSATSTIGYTCSYNAYDCENFATYQQAQAVYIACGGVDNDVHHLDRDLDGMACETLPRTSASKTIAQDEPPLIKVHSIDFKRKLDYHDADDGKTFAIVDFTVENRDINPLYTFVFRFILVDDKGYNYDYNSATFSYSDTTVTRHLNQNEKQRMIIVYQVPNNINKDALELKYNS